MRPTTEEQVQQYQLKKAMSELPSSDNQIEVFGLTTSGVIALGVVADYFLTRMVFQLLYFMQHLFPLV